MMVAEVRFVSKSSIRPVRPVRMVELHPDLAEPLARECIDLYNDQANSRVTDGEEYEITLKVSTRKNKYEIVQP